MTAAQRAACVWSTILFISIRAMLYFMTAFLVQVYCVRVSDRWLNRMLPSKNDA